MSVIVRGQQQAISKQEQQQPQEPKDQKPKPPPSQPPQPQPPQPRSQSKWSSTYRTSASRHSASLWRVVRSRHGCRAPLKPRFWGLLGSAKQAYYRTHQTTTHRKIYKNCLVCDTCIRELMVLDVPPQKRFPADNFAEWNNGHPLGLRTVHAYVLVYDMGNLETFQYCRSMRDQILDSFSHRDFSIIVVGNKFDNVTEAQANSQELKDISTLVRKHWRCGYVECSAQYNYKIGDVFRELMGCTSTGGGGGAGGGGGMAGVGGLVGTEYSQSTRNKGRCTIL
ncbi:GTP-binding protein rhb1 [Drosophila mauritiana]|uniref:GTP-binding protein rhb1 n=1 Tax=Drosophila mauritiana TaxID=7226 RepID=A0A6P8KEI1_DROMA|nr:GTP-binding protein rhb1 [Drosophila mauritiana]